jgi:hypothetical protein
MLKKPEKKTQRRKPQPAALKVPEIAKHFGYQVAPCTNGSRRESSQRDTCGDGLAIPRKKWRSIEMP